MCYSEKNKIFKTENSPKIRLHAPAAPVTKFNISSTSNTSTPPSHIACLLSCTHKKNSIACRFILVFD